MNPGVRWWLAGAPLMPLLKTETPRATEAATRGDQRPQCHNSSRLNWALAGVARSKNRERGRACLRRVVGQAVTPDKSVRSSSVRMFMNQFAPSPVPQVAARAHRVAMPGRGAGAGRLRQLGLGERGTGARSPSPAIPRRAPGKGSTAGREPSFFCACHPPLRRPPCARDWRGRVRR